MLLLALMVASVKAKPVERIRGLTSINEEDQAGEKPIATRGDCFKCSDVFQTLINVEARHDLVKRSPKKLKKKGKKFGKKTLISSKKGFKKFGKKSKKGGKKAKKGGKKSKPFLKKGGKKAFKIGKKGLKASAPLSIPAGSIGIPAGGGALAFGVPAFGAFGGTDGLLGATALDAAVDGGLGAAFGIDTTG